MQLKRGRIFICTERDSFMKPSLVWLLRVQQLLGFKMTESKASPPWRSDVGATSPFRVP